MGHPAIAATLGRIVEMTSNARLSGRRCGSRCCPTACCSTNGRLPADAAVTELAELLHSHVIGALTVRAGGDVEAWRNFLLLLGRAPDALRAEGGIARVWATTAGQHLELREIDYAQVLRERTAGKAAVWDRVIANCLQGGIVDLDDEAIRELLEVAGNSEQLAELVTELEARRERRRRDRRPGRRRAAPAARHRGRGRRRANRSASNRCCGTWRAPSAS